MSYLSLTVTCNDSGNICISTFPAAEDTKTDASSSKESPIPAELSAVVEALKTVIKEEKSVSSELSHTTDKQMVQVRADTEALQQMVTGLCSTLQNNRYYIMYANIYIEQHNILKHT